MAKDPHVKCVKKLLRMLKAADRHVLRVKKELRKVLQSEDPDPYPVKTVNCTLLLPSGYCAKAVRIGARRTRVSASRRLRRL